MEKTTKYVLLIPKLRSNFAEFLRGGYLFTYSLLNQQTCVGLGYSNNTHYNWSFSWVDRTDERQNFGFELLFSYLYQLPPPPPLLPIIFFLTFPPARFFFIKKNRDLKIPTARFFIKIEPWDRGGKGNGPLRVGPPEPTPPLSGGGAVGLCPTS